MTPSRPVVFTPMQGTLALLGKLAVKLGLSEIWNAPDGWRDVAEQKLTELGIPTQPIPLNGAQRMTPRQMAERSGFIRRRAGI